MAIRDRKTLKTWFVRGAYPTAAQFADWIDSYVHKSDKVAISDVEGLANTLNTKAEASSVETAVEAANSAQETANNAIAYADSAQNSADEALEALEAIGAIEIEDINELFEEE